MVVRWWRWHPTQQEVGTQVGACPGDRVDVYQTGGAVGDQTISNLTRARALHPIHRDHALVVQLVLDVARSGQQTALRRESTS